MPRSSKAASDIPKPRLSGFAPAIDLLLAFEIPAKRLAELFGTNPDYIYVLAHRGRLGTSHHVAEDNEVHIETAIRSSVDDYALEANTALGIRAEEDAVELTRSKATKLEWLESRMEDIVSSGRYTYQFLQAARYLKALKPYIGYPSESNRLRLAAKLHQHLSWFYSHSGFTSSSIAEATRSIRLYEIVFHNTGDKDALRELGGSCLINSNSHLLQGQPEGALAVLNIARGATEAAAIALNSDYFRQQGVALFQTRDDDVMAKKMFERSMATTPDSQVNHGGLTLRMSGARHLNLIAAPFPCFDDELLLLDEAKAAYGVDSLEASMCVHWAAACGLSTDSPHAHDLALDLIRQNQSNVARFGHQATIAKLLPLALELPAGKRARWVRFALYQNAYHSK